MPSPVELAVEHVESTQEGSAVCVVRCLSGVVEPGTLVLAGTDAEAPAQDGTLRIDWIKRYERMVDILDPPHNAKVQLSGPTVSYVRHGTRLRSTAPH
ncbi:hypothetical protein SAMN06297387_106112 [Streptomyces zhaozhouensis]|uniref:Uncharacterized protein n=1 Tax=Streptomyces zhaozhouensis TaxID=1300267 RepID=A0A286DV46_9ACTN|nr:hypothetical protein [Streptomyces zhaozhouensis]SOD62535.1 hypothetical protein SAMN06297387_106112 [Streptomyces zhaozhouensis]